MATITHEGMVSGERHIVLPPPLGRVIGGLALAAGLSIAMGPEVAHPPISPSAPVSQEAVLAEAPPFLAQITVPDTAITEPYYTAPTPSAKKETAFFPTVGKVGLVLLGVSGVASVVGAIVDFRQRGKRR